MSQSDIQLYLPTTLDTKVNLKASKINQFLDQNIQLAVERKYGGHFFSFGHVRPGTIKLVQRSIGNKIGSSDFTGNISFNVIFQCEVYLPQIGQEISARVKSVNKIGILAKSDTNKLTLLLSKPHQTNLELFAEIMPETRILAKILDFKIDSQNNTIVVIGDLLRILEGVYQNYQLPQVTGVKIDIRGDIQPSTDIKTLYVNYDNFLDSVNSKSLMDPYSMFPPENIDYKTWNQMRKKKNWQGFKDYWRKVRSMVEDYELVYPSGGYNQNKGVAILPFKAKPVSRAYFKLWELLHRYKDIVGRLDTTKTLTILNLGECPGGFIQCLGHYRLKEYNVSSDLYYCYSIKLDDDEQLSWDNPVTKEELGKFPNNLYNLKYGDLTEVATIKSILAEMNGAKADLITADGAYTHSKVYNYEEVVNYKIFFSEIVTALLNQKIGGNFVLKIFDLLTQVTRQLLLLLNNYYSEVFVTKPDFSRPASSEKYLVCLGFKGLTAANQTEESAAETFLTLLTIWNEKINDRMDIYYPNNEAFLLSLLSYTVGEDDEFALKLEEINKDHIKQQSDHINKGVHLIHTRDIFKARKVEQLKNNQLKKAVLWCQRYNLEAKEDIDILNETFIESEIINTSRMLSYSTKTVQTDDEETYKYVLSEYQYLSLDYLHNQSLAMFSQIEPILSDYQDQQIYQYKTSLLNVTPLLNNELKQSFGTSWYSIYEILDNVKELTKGSGKLRVFINLDSITADVVQSVDQYITNQTGRKLEWVASLIWQEDLPDPSGWISKYPNQWLMNKGMNGDFTQISNLEMLEKTFEKEKVDLYLSDFRIPLAPELAEMFITDPERFYIRDYVGQLLAGMISLKDGGNLVMRQYTFFNKITVGLLAWLNHLFEMVQIVKPLVSLPENPEIYVVATNFNLKKFTKQMKTDMYDTLEELPDRVDLLDDDLPLPELSPSLSVSDKEIKTLSDNLIYIAYRIYVLNQFPKIQINLDLFTHPTYQLSSQEESSLRHILGENQEITNKATLSNEDQQELMKNNKMIDDLFSGVTKKIIEEDFRYVIDETMTNWLEQHTQRK